MPPAMTTAITATMSDAFSAAHDAGVPPNVAGRAGGTAGLIRLMTWLSPAFPVGAFAFSHGLEAAVREGPVGDAEALLGWIRTLLHHGSGWNDFVLFAEAHRSAAADAESLEAAVELATALAGSKERREETLALGAAFLAAAAPWGAEDIPADAPYPVAVGATAAGLGIDLESALAGFAHAFAANLASAGVRLVPLGQSQAVRILKALETDIADAAGRAAGSTLDDLGSAAIAAEIAAMRHETLQPRLFRT